jgi:hypothetical protein
MRHLGLLDAPNAYKPHDMLGDGEVQPRGYALKYGTVRYDNVRYRYRQCTIDCTILYRIVRYCIDLVVYHGT